jgi:hypothetical protein
MRDARIDQHDIARLRIECRSIGGVVPAGPTISAMIAV